MQLNEKEDFFLRCYKGEFPNDDLANKIFPDINNYPKKKFDLFSNLFPNLQDDGWWKKSLEYENINSFLNFINNPSNSDYYRKINISFLDGTLDMIKTLIDLSCKYALYDDKDYLLNRYENINNNQSNFLTSFKSTSSKDISTGEIDFAKNNSILVRYSIDKFCPHIAVDKLIPSVMNDESEILLPPFLSCNYNNETLCYEVSLSPNYDYDFIKLLFEIDENKFNTLKEEFGHEFIELQRTGKISSTLEMLSNFILNYLKKYALLKYQEYYLIYKDDIAKKLVK